MIDVKQIDLVEKKIDRKIGWNLLLRHNLEFVFIKKININSFFVESLMNPTGLFINIKPLKFISHVCP